MKIAIIGTHSTGKTQLTNRLVSYLRSKGLEVGHIAELARKCPIKVNEETTLNAQKWILVSQIDEEGDNADKDVVISDRSILDNYIYLYRALGKDHESLYPLVLDHLKTYDVLFLTKVNPDLGIKDDGFRSINDPFRNDIEKMLYDRLEALAGFLKQYEVDVIRINDFDDIKKTVDVRLFNKW